MRSGALLVPEYDAFAGEPPGPHHHQRRYPDAGSSFRVEHADADPLPSIQNTPIMGVVDIREGEDASMKLLSEKFHQTPIETRQERCAAAYR